MLSKGSDHLLEEAHTLPPLSKISFKLDDSSLKLNGLIGVSFWLTQYCPLLCWNHISRVDPVCERQIYLKKYYPTKCRKVVGEWDKLHSLKGSHLRKHINDKVENVPLNRSVGNT